MKAPRLPENEIERRAALDRLVLLDTPGEERFDRVTRLARRLLGVPIALVSLVDADRQWFKSAQGLEATETPRDVSFCGHAILEEDAFIVSDASQDSRFADNPLVTGEPGVRFYAGIPLASPDGYRVGTLCVIDRKPRNMGIEDLQSLQDLAAMVEKELEASHLSHVEKDLRERLVRAERQASIDPITRAWDRTTILKILDGAFAYSSRQGQPLSIILLRLDRFAGLVDTHGDRAGNVTLRIAADRTRRALRRYDSLGRCGEREFLIVLPDADGDTAQRVGTRIQERIAEKPVSHGQAEFPVTGSVGIATFPGSGDFSPTALIRSAEMGTTPPR